MKCEECGDTLDTTGRCVNIDCEMFWALGDEFANVQELDFERDNSDRYGASNREQFIADLVPVIEDDFPEDFEDEEPTD